MNKANYIKEINENIFFLDLKKIKEVNNFVKFLKYKDYIDPTLEILSNEEWGKKVEIGLAEKAKNEVTDWDLIK